MSKWELPGLVLRHPSLIKAVPRIMGMSMAALQLAQLRWRANNQPLLYETHYLIKRKEAAVFNQQIARARATYHDAVRRQRKILDDGKWLAGESIRLGVDLASTLLP